MSLLRLGQPMGLRFIPRLHRLTLVNATLARLARVTTASIGGSTMRHISIAGKL